MKTVIKYFLRGLLRALGFKFCEYCGHFLRGDARKCSNCGSPVRSADVFSWGWCALGLLLFPVGLIGAIVFACKKQKEIAKSALIGSIVQIVMIGIAAALFIMMSNKGISLL